MYETLPPADRNEFDNQTIRTVVVRNWKSDDFLFAVFLRLNTGNLPLSPQELRQALHPGPFVRFVNKFTATSDDFKAMLRTDKPDFRMRDVELLVRFFAFDSYLPGYTGNLKPLLDTTCEDLNLKWPTQEARIRASAKACEAGIRTTMTVFGANAFRRYSGHGYERPFNRAVYDVVMFYFKDASVRAAAEEHQAAVVDAFEKVCGVPEFAEAITTTTKSIDAIDERLTRWGAALETALSQTLPIPSLVDGHITYE
jgi:hypothetical protein